MHVKHPSLPIYSTVLSVKKEKASLQTLTPSKITSLPQYNITPFHLSIPERTTLTNAHIRISYTSCYDTRLSAWIFQSTSHDHARGNERTCCIPKLSSPPTRTNQSIPQNNLNNLSTSISPIIHQKPYDSDKATAFTSYDPIQPSRWPETRNL